jgi:HK97 family phage portal protein
MKLPRWWRRAAPMETRDSYYAPVFAGSATAGSFVVNARTAENLSTVLACVQAIASGIASLPARVYRATDKGRIEAPKHPVSRVLAQPNLRQTWPDFCETMLGQALLYGNALAVIEHDGAGRPVALIPVPWANVVPVLLPSSRLAFDVVAYTAPWGGSGQPRRYFEDEVFHLKDRSDDGWLGRSRISRAPDVLGAAIGLQTFSRSIWDNAASPSALVSVPSGISPDGLRRLDAFFRDRYAGAANGRRIILVDKDTTWTPVAVSPEDAEVLASRQFTVAEICRLFQVPPPIVQDYAHNTFTNASQADLWFARHSLMPWARKIEAEFSRSVFSDPNGEFSLEIDFNGLTRGDYATRWAANVAAVGAGILTRDEVREQEGYAPLPASAAQATTAAVA